MQISDTRMPAPRPRASHRASHRALHGAPLIAVAAGLFVWIAAMGAMIVLPEDRAAAARDVQEPSEILILHQDARTFETVAIREARPL